MKLGANSVLFGGYPLERAFECLAWAGYDGIELSAIDGMSEHLVLERRRELAPAIRKMAAESGLDLLAIEQPSLDPGRMQMAFEAAADLGIPVVNCGPGGKSGDEASLADSIAQLSALADMAGRHGVTLCVKAHVGAAIHDTPTTQRALEAIQDASFGLDMDPSHIHRAGEDAVQALAAVVARIRHVHIRDCAGRGPAPGPPEMQANGRGDINLVGYVAELHRAGYDGALDLEIIGAKEYPLERCCVIAAEARGHMQAALQACGAR